MGAVDGRPGGASAAGLTPNSAAVAASRGLERLLVGRWSAAVLELSYDDSASRAVIARLRTFSEWWSPSISAGAGHRRGWPDRSPGRWTRWLRRSTRRRDAGGDVAGDPAGQVAVKWLA